MKVLIGFIEKALGPLNNFPTNLSEPVKDFQSLLQSSSFNGTLNLSGYLVSSTKNAFMLNALTGAAPTGSLIYSGQQR